MKIALCGRFNTDKRHQGGSAEVFLTLAELLSKHHEITLFGRGKPTKDIVDMCKKNNIKYHYIPSDTIFNILMGPFRARRLLKKYWDNFDIIHSHTGSFAWASIYFRGKAKIITHVHEISIPNKNSIIVTAYMNLQNFLMKKASKKSNLVITVSDYMVNLIKNKWKIKKIISIPNGTDLNLFKPIKYNKVLLNKHKRLLFVGRLTRRKGILELIDAFKLIKDKNYRLLIIGNGDLNSIVEENIKSDTRINLIHHVKNRDLSRYYNSSDLVIVPSYYEPSGLVPRETLACGIPVLLAKNTALKEIEAGYFFNKVTSKEIVNSIKRVLSKKTYSKEVLRSYAEENFDWNKILNKYEEKYRILR